MIEPDFNLMLWIILITGIISAIANIIMGVEGTEKHTHYGYGEIIIGSINLILLGWVILK